MASGDPARALDQDSLTELSAVNTPGKFLSQVHFVIEASEEGANPVVAACSVVHVRQGGFMLVIPNSEVLQDALFQLDLGEVAPAFHDISVEVLTARGKSLGVGEMLLVDLPWEAVGAFCRPVSFRAAKFRTGRANPCASKWSKWSPVSRPSAFSCRCLGRNWIGRRNCTRVPDWRGSVSRNTCSASATSNFAFRSRASRPRIPAAVEEGSRVRRAAQGHSAGSRRSSAFGYSSSTFACIPDRSFECRTMGADSKACWHSSSSSWPGRNPQTICTAHDRFPRPRLSQSGKGSRGRYLAGGCEPASNDFRRPAPTSSGSPTSAEPASDATFAPKTSGPCPWRAVRIGQRKRQQLQRQRLFSQGSIPENHPGFAPGCYPGSTKCHERVGLGPGQTRFLPDETVRGTPNPLAGVQAVIPGGNNACRIMGHWLRQPGQAVDGVGLQDVAVRRTNCARWGKDPAQLVTFRVPRTCESHADVLSKEARPRTICPPMSSALGRGQSEFSPRPRLHGDQNGVHRKAQPSKDVHVRRREGNEAKTQVQGQEGPRERRQRRVSGAASCQLGAGTKQTKSEHVHPEDFVRDDPPSQRFSTNSSFADAFCQGRFADLKFDPIKLMQVLCDEFWRCPTGLTYFAKASLTSASCTVRGPKHGPLWPVPPFRWRWTASLKPNPRRRRRRKLLEVRSRLVNLLLCTLNWEMLGHPKVPPSCAQLGAPISEHQHGIIERFEAMLTHFLSMAPFEGSELGRAAGKFQGLIDSLMELPKANLGYEDLFDVVSELHKSFDPYGSHFASKQKLPNPPCNQEPVTSCGTVTVSIPSAKPVESARVKWENPPSFDAAGYLDPLVREAFREPEVLRKPPNAWPKSRPAKMHINKTEMLKLIERWDKLGACSLIRSDCKDFQEAVGVFAVDKDADYDRLIINPKTINRRMHTLSHSTRELAPGSMLGLLSLKPEQMFRFNADDLSDYYYCFKVTPERASRNAFRMKFQSHELKHLHCFSRDEHEGHELLVCLATLAMGDSLAVEVAQQAHTNVLKVWCGSMVSGECLRYRAPIPRTDFVELLAIDDHVGLQKLPIKDFAKTPKLRDTEVFASASTAYKAVGLVQHPKKQKRNQSSGVILGADFDGIAGVVMAPRSRVAVLSLITLQVALIGHCTPRILAVLLGCWIHVLLFRRVLFACVDQLFKEGVGLKQDDVFRLSAQGRCELQLLAIVGPTAQSNLRATHSTRIYSTDASPFGGAVIAADIGQEASAELWRHCEQRGYYTRLQSPVAEILAEKGITPLSSELIQPDSPSPDIPSLSVPPPIHEGILFDCIEIFRDSGNWSNAHAERQLRVHHGVDVSGRKLRFWDLSEPAVFHELCALALRRVCLDWHAGVPRLSFNSEPISSNPDEPFTAYHHMLARRTAFLMTIVLLSGHYISIEQPGNSRLFLLHCYRVLVSLGCVISHFCFCFYGSPFQKASKWLHNKPWILSLECSCNCPHKGRHFAAQGSFNADNLKDFEQRCRPSSVAVYGRSPQIGEAVSNFSVIYPVRLVQAMASGLSQAIRGSVASIPLSYKARSLIEVGFDPVDIPLSRNTEIPYPPRPWHESPEWISELCNFLPFRELFRYRFKTPGHINVNEMRTYKSFIKACAKTEPDSRVVGLLDSRVTIGAAAKGRSSSLALSKVLKGTIGYVLGAGLYPGLLHCPSEVNRSDGPSRDRDIAPPTRDAPRWFERLQQGDPTAFDHVVQSSRISKNPARWLRFLLLLAGDIEENPGPTKQGRGQLDLNVGFVRATADRMAKCLAAFSHWCANSLEIPFGLLATDMSALAWSLRAYGLYLFEAGLPRYLLVYAITACQDQYPGCKPLMNVAWQIDKKWQLHEPGSCRAVLPAVVIKAMVSLSTLWRWFNWTGIVLLGFAAMLHPSEMMALTRRDLVFPSDLHYDNSALYVRVKDPKTARFARRQHSRIDDASIIAVVEAVFGHLALDDRLYPGTINTFRKQWNEIMRHLGVPCKQQDKGATPGVLRGSGATFFYSCTEDLAWVAWRGRWSRIKTLEFYLQEVGSQMLIHELPEWSRAKVFALSDAAPAVLTAGFHLQSSF